MFDPSPMVDLIVLSPVVMSAAEELTVPPVFQVIPSSDSFAAVVEVMMTPLATALSASTSITKSCAVGGTPASRYSMSLSATTPILPARLAVSSSWLDSPLLFPPTIVVPSPATGLSTAEYCTRASLAPSISPSVFVSTASRTMKTISPSTSAL